MSFDDLHDDSRGGGPESILHQILPVKTALPWRGCAKRIPLQRLADAVMLSVAQRLEPVQVQVASPLVLALNSRLFEVSIRVVDPTKTKRVGSGLAEALAGSGSHDGERGPHCLPEGCLLLQKKTPAHTAHNEGR